MPDVRRDLRRLTTRGRRPAEATDIRRFKKALLAAGIPLGGPEAKLEGVGRKTLAAMIDAGLQPDHRVLDVGAGSLRVGWWLLHYIEASNYHAIEPLADRVDTAAGLLGADINIYYNDDFVFPDQAFHFVVARSVWTHASKPMIATMISEFAAKSVPGAGFLASMKPAENEEDDYDGEAWVGKGVDSDEPGMVHHSLDWVESQCRQHGLTMKLKGELNHQTWVLIRKPR